MANTTMNLSCIGTAWCDKDNPNVNYSSASSYEMKFSGWDPITPKGCMLLKFSKFTSSLRRQKLVSAVIKDYYSADQGTAIGYNFTCSLKSVDDFTESTVTYANQPQWRTRIGTTRVYYNQVTGVWEENPVPMPNITTLSNDRIASAILRDSCISVEPATALYVTNRLTFNGRRASQKPTLTVTYDNAVKVVYKPVSYSASKTWFNRFEDNKISWTIQKADTAYCVADPVQASARFQWRNGSSGSWQTINVPNNAQEVTIPAGTWPGTGTLQWRIVVTDDLGDTLTGDTCTTSTLAGDLTAEPASPINGAFVDPVSVNTFSWTNTNGHNITTQSAASLQYSTNGSTWSSLGSVSGSTQTFAVPANTFSNAGTYYWRVRATNVDGTVGPWSDAAEFSTVDTTMYGIPLHPVSEICDYAAKIKFQWSYSSDTGTTAQRTDLQTSVNGVDWTTLTTRSAGVLTYTAAANTFAAGTVYWRIRCYNSNNVAGPWSEAVSFIAFGAPPRPSISVDAVPFATIRWQSSGQIAYKVTVDGVDYGPFFGTDKSYALRDYLRDGPHTASVSIQGAYGLWSPSATAQFTIENTPGAPVVLTGKLRLDATLTWTTSNTTRNFLVYRDGVQIGHTSGFSFTDRTVLGSHEWRVIQRLANGNYTESNAVRGTLCTCVPAIASLSGGEWLELIRSVNENRVETYIKNQTTSLRQFAGQVYPQVETSPYRSMQATFDVAWTWDEREAAEAFEALIGSTVIFKGPGGEAIVGMLSAWNRESSLFYRAYNVTVQRVHWRDWVDEDD